MFLELLKDLVPSPASRHDIRGGNETVDTRPVVRSGLSCGCEGSPGGPLSFSLTWLHFLLPRSSSLHSIDQCEHRLVKPVVSVSGDLPVIVLGTQTRRCHVLGSRDWCTMAMTSIHSGRIR